eukprot:GHRQ01020514.1.p1 GENE.GHRQ01020514.1~~GHRQ01020514.1.p1  ORF type:complete len:213 (+),score=68.15 GHRQ01020514.1:973-1611(+)
MHPHTTMAGCTQHPLSCCSTHGSRWLAVLPSPQPFSACITCQLRPHAVRQGCLSLARPLLLLLGWLCARAVHTHACPAYAAEYNAQTDGCRICCTARCVCGLWWCFQVKSRQLWGEDIYTDDSDLVAVLLHLGYYASNNTASNPLVARFYAQVPAAAALVPVAAASSIPSNCGSSSATAAAAELQQQLQRRITTQHGRRGLVECASRGLLRC